MSSIIPGRLADFNLSDEATALLREESPGAQAAAIARAFLWQTLRQRAFWEADHTEVGEAERNAAAREMEVRVEDIREALRDAMDPVRCAARMFVNDLAASEGDVGAIREAYGRRRAWEAPNRFMKFDDDMVGPYRFELVKMFEAVARQARTGNEEAQTIFKDLLIDFGKISGADFRAWLKRIMLNTIDSDMARIVAEETLRRNPERFDNMIDAYLSGGSTAVAGLLAS